MVIFAGVYKPVAIPHFQGILSKQLGTLTKETILRRISANCLNTFFDQSFVVGVLVGGRERSRGFLRALFFNFFFSPCVSRTLRQKLREASR